MRPSRSGSCPWGNASPAYVSGPNPVTVTILDNIPPPPPLSDNADLASLTFSNITLSPNFQADDTTYTGIAPFDLDTTVVTAVPAASAATVVITPVDTDTSSEEHNLEIDTTPRSVTVVVTAQDQATQKTYTVTITKQPVIIDITSLDSNLDPISEVTEGEPIIFRVTRTGTTTQPQTFTIQVTEQGEFTDATSVNFTFQPTNTTAHAQVDTVDDDTWEEHGRITLTHQSYSSAVEVLDNDFPATGMTISVNKNPLAEKDGSVTATVKATTDDMEQPHDSRTFEIRTTDGTATSGDDYAETTTTFKFDPTNFTPNGTSDYSATKTTQIRIMEDSKQENDETFDIWLVPMGNASPAYVSGQNPITVTILDNSPKPVTPDPIRPPTPEPTPVPTPVPTPAPTPRPYAGTHSGTNARPYAGTHAHAGARAGTHTGTYSRSYTATD